MNTQSGMKGILKLVVGIAVLLLLVRWCSSRLGSVITLPGGTGQESTEGPGGWFSPKEQTGGSVSNPNLEQEVEDLEREMGIGKYKGQTPSVNTPSTTPSTSSSSSPLTFKGIPITGSLSAFGTELVKAGFSSAGNGVYTGNFAGYSGCRVTPSGSNPVQEVRVDFPVISDWDALEKSYDSLQASLTQKYGIEPKTSSDSNVAVYDLPGGTITLDADVKDRSTWHVILKYTNALSATPSTGSLGRNPIDDL